MGECDPSESDASASGLRILKPCDIVAIDEALLAAGREAEVSLVIEDGRLIQIRTLPLGTVIETTEAESTAAQVAAPGHRASAPAPSAAGKRRDRAGKRKSKKR